MPSWQSQRFVILQGIRDRVQAEGELAIELICQSLGQVPETRCLASEWEIHLSWSHAIGSEGRL